MTAYKVVLSKLAKQKFDQFIRADRKIGEQLAQAIDKLAADPQQGEFLKGEWKGYRKFRTGRYRIIYRIESGQLIIFILTIDDRKEVYR